MRILFLDDNEFRHKKMMKNSIGFSVSQAFNAQEAISLLREKEFELIMLDHDLDNATQNEVNNDEEDGRFVCRWMADNGTHSQTPIVIHSLNAVGAAGMERILKSAGFEEVHQVPFAWAIINKADNGSIIFDTDKPFSLDDYREA